MRCARGVGAFTFVNNYYLLFFYIILNIFLRSPAMIPALEQVLAAEP
ncbi:MAG: hypothetical protein HY286_04585 [Planctomycetes bacterium]|nr:hypothetical protein [Planctomycetota bacterium]